VLGAQATEPPAPVSQAEAVTGEGLRGDRYFRSTGEGTFSKEDKWGQDVTLVEAEALERLAAEHGVEVSHAESRRNVLTRGIGLNDLVGRRFRVGEVELAGQRLCDPCAHLAKLTDERVLKGLADRGGLRADVLKGGRIAPGDRVEDLGPIGEES